MYDKVNNSGWCWVRLINILMDLQFSLEYYDHINNIKNIIISFKNIIIDVLFFLPKDIIDIW